MTLTCQCLWLVKPVNFTQFMFDPAPSALHAVSLPRPGLETTEQEEKGKFGGRSVELNIVLRGFLETQSVGQRLLCN